MAVIPLDTSDTEKAVADAFASLKNKGDKGEDKTKLNNDDAARRRVGQADAEKRKRLKDELVNANTSLARQQEINEELKAMNDTTTAERDELKSKLAEAQRKIEEMEPVVKATKAEEHRKRSILLEKIPKEERDIWKDTPLRALEIHVNKTPAQDGAPGKGKDGKYDFKDLIDKSGTDEGLKALDAAMKADPKGFEEFNKPAK